MSVLQTIDKSSPPQDDDSLSEFGLGCSDTAQPAAVTPLMSTSTTIAFVKKLVWRGKVAMHGINKFTARAYAVSGRTRCLSKVC